MLLGEKWSKYLCLREKTYTFRLWNASISKNLNALPCNYQDGQMNKLEAVVGTEESPDNKWVKY